MWDTIAAWVNSAGQKIARRYPLFTQQVDVSTDAAVNDKDYSANPLRGIYVGGSGSVFVKGFDDTAFFEWAVLQGAHIPGLIIAVKAAPSATKLVGYR